MRLREDWDFIEHGKDIFRRRNAEVEFCSDLPPEEAARRIKGHSGL